MKQARKAASARKEGDTDPKTSDAAVKDPAPPPPQNMFLGVYCREEEKERKT